MNQQPMNSVKKPVTKDQLIEEFNAVVAETEHLLKSVATAGGEQAGALRDSAEKKLASAKDRLLRLQHTAAEKTGAIAKTTDEYAHEHPWQVIGIAAGVAAVVGVALTILLNRR
jgi:ElaB/YqjD/DUF883 family membrane-anchored ribosome-binding protein